MLLQRYLLKQLRHSFWLWIKTQMKEFQLKNYRTMLKRSICLLKIVLQLICSMRQQKVEVLFMNIRNMLHLLQKRQQLQSEADIDGIHKRNIGKLTIDLVETIGLYSFKLSMRDFSLFLCQKQYQQRSQLNLKRKILRKQ